MIGEPRPRWPMRAVRGLGAITIGAIMATGMVVPAHARPNDSDIPRPPRYVALGDSYASGEGGSSYWPGTDTPGVNECHRSPDAYPEQLARRLGMQPVHVVACSRATIDSMAKPAWSDQASQLEALNSNVELVTVTIGGNEADLEKTLKTCLLSRCSPGTPVYERTMELFESAQFKQRLTELYQTILERAPNARVAVVPYPIIIKGRPVCTVLGHKDDKAVEAMITALNDSIYDVVHEVNSPRLIASSAPVIDPCSRQGAINWLPTPDNLRHPTNLAHPKFEGHKMIADRVAEALYPSAA